MIVQRHLPVYRQETAKYIGANLIGGLDAQLGIHTLRYGVERDPGKREACIDSGNPQDDRIMMSGNSIDQILGSHACGQTEYRHGKTQKDIYNDPLFIAGGIAVDPLGFVDYVAQHTGTNFFDHLTEHCLTAFAKKSRRETGCQEGSFFLP